MTDLTPEQIERWAGDKACALLQQGKLQIALRNLEEFGTPGVSFLDVIHAQALHLQQQAENAEQQATIERLKEAARNLLASERNPKLGLGHRADVDAASVRDLELALQEAGE